MTILQPLGEPIKNLQTQLKVKKFGCKWQFGNFAILPEFLNILRLASPWCGLPRCRTLLALASFSLPEIRLRRWPGCT